MTENLDSYSVQDFMLFSKSIYQGLFELYNISIWPLQCLFVAFNFGVTVLLLRNSQPPLKTICLLFSCYWTFIGYWFHLHHFTSINWVAPYFAGLCFLQALFLGIAPLTSSKPSTPIQGPRYRLGSGLFLMGAYFYILFLWVEGRDVNQWTLLGWGPNATALGTLGLIQWIQGRMMRWILSMPSLIWLAVSVVIAYGLKSNGLYWLLPCLILVAILLILTDLSTNRG